MRNREIPHPGNCLTQALCYDCGLSIVFEHANYVPKRGALINNQISVAKIAGLEPSAAVQYTTRSGIILGYLARGLCGPAPSWYARTANQPQKPSTIHIKSPTLGPVIATHRALPRTHSRPKLESHEDYRAFFITSADLRRPNSLEAAWLSCRASTVSPGGDRGSRAPS